MTVSVWSLDASGVDASRGIRGAPDPSLPHTPPSAGVSERKKTCARHPTDRPDTRRRSAAEGPSDVHVSPRAKRRWGVCMTSSRPRRDNATGRPKTGAQFRTTSNHDAAAWPLRDPRRVAPTSSYTSMYTAVVRWRRSAFPVDNGCGVASHPGIRGHRSLSPSPMIATPSPKATTNVPPSETETHNAARALVARLLGQNTTR